MKKNYMIKYFFTLLLLTSSFLGKSQNRGDIAFVGLNTDGDKDFAIVALADLAPNTIIFFTDNEPNQFADGLADQGEGNLIWDTGAGTISAGTVVVFNNVNTVTMTASIGIIINDPDDLGFNPSGSGDAIYAFTTTDDLTPDGLNIDVWIAGIQNLSYNDTSQRGDYFHQTLLSEGETFIAFGVSGNSSPDGGFYNGLKIIKQPMRHMLATTLLEAHQIGEEVLLMVN